MITWYLQGFVGLGWWPLFTSALAASVCQALAYGVTGETLVVLWISMVPSPLPTSNSLKQLRINSSVFACNYSKNLTRHPWKLSTFHRNRYHLCAQVMCPMFFSSWCKIFPYYDCKLHGPSYFHIWVWGNMGHRLWPDAFATVLVGREHTCQSTSGTNVARSKEEAFQICKLLPLPNHKFAYIYIYIYYIYIYNTGMSFL